MGGKSGKGASTPYEAPNTLSSAQSLRIVDVISEGEVSGFANGENAPFQSVYFNDTPVQNADGSFNFKGVVGYFLRGTPDQSYIPGFDVSERTVSVSAQVKKTAPVVRAVTDSLVDRLRVTVGVQRNSHVKDNGDTVAADTRLKIELVGAGVTKEQTVSFSEKGSDVFYQDVVFAELPPVPFNVRVSRLSDDAASDKTSNATYFSSFVEIIDAKMSYPNSALAALAIDSDQFGNNVPKRNYLLRGKLVSVPSNYDPETRTYAGDTWDGSFKTAWTNNPAWIFYDVLVSKRYSTLARRLKLADIDKWTLYQIGRYCDELVDDGFGGKEPRYVCNAYITDQRQAGDLLTDLASVFCGLPLWNGNQVSVVLDADADPIAVYNNSNVVDGEFTYGGAAYKSIHTAVHVRYLDKNDGYRPKTEYIADDDAVKRYGLNIKQVEAFGCDSRGQAARFGAWILQTELRQQHTVSFSVGREGLKHLPYDVIQVMDNRYAGAELSGRIKDVSEDTVTLDREVSVETGAAFYYTDSGGLKTLTVKSQLSANRLTLSAAPVGMVSDVFALGSKVEPRLFRCIGISEDTDEGTFTISALLHDPAKYTDVDTWASFDRSVTTLHTIEPRLVNGSIDTDNGAVVISWDNLSASGSVLMYDIKIYRGGKLFRHIPDSDAAEVRLENLPNGDYVAEIRGRNARGVLSEPLIKAWSVNYTITGVRASEKVFAVGLDWVLPPIVVSSLVTEIWYSKSDNFQTATLLSTLPYPQNSYTLTGVGIADEYCFWLRIRDLKAGLSGEFTDVAKGRASRDANDIVDLLTGAVSESLLTKELVDKIKSADGGAVLEGKTMLKSESVGADGKRVISGVIVGTNEKTATSEILFYGNQMGLVVPGTDKIVMPWTLQSNGNETNMALDGNMFSTGSILGKHIAANQSIEAPVINGGEIHIGNGVADIWADGSVSFNNGRFRGNIEAVSGTFSGQVSSVKIIGDVFKGFRFHYQGGGWYRAHFGRFDWPVLAEFPAISFPCGAEGRVDYYLGGVFLKSISMKAVSVLANSRAWRDTQPDGWKVSASEYILTAPSFSVPIFPGSECIVEMRLYGWTSDPFEHVGNPICYYGMLSEYDPDYASMVGNLNWHPVDVGEFLYDGAESIQNGVARIRKGLGDSKHCYAYFNRKVSGVRFDYRTEVNTDSELGVFIQTPTGRNDLVYSGRAPRSHDFVTVYVEFGHFTNFSIFFNQTRWFQWLDIRNVQVLTV